MKKGYLLLIIVLLIVIIGCIWSYLSHSRIETPTVDESVGAPLEKVTDRNNYYMVENCVNKFYSYYSEIYENKNHEKEDIEKTYNLLDKEYISYKNISKENLDTILPEINESTINIYDMYISKQTEEIHIYIARGILREELSKELAEFQIMIKIDLTNKAFSVLLQDYIEAKYQNIVLGNKVTIQNLNNIEKNKNNSYVLEEISDEDYMLDLFDRYQEEVLYNQDLAYEHLDAEYKNIKFPTIEIFKEFTANNKDRHNKMKLEQYKVSKQEEYTQYIGMDQYGYYYIFRETELMKYDLILDTYTVDLPEFLEKYNKAIHVDRVGYNIQKVLDALNYKDYEYVYNKLDFEFKAINYATLESFEQVIKTKLFDLNKVKQVKSYTEGSTHVFKLIITDMKDNTKEQKMTIVMKLLEGTDFVMSFSFEE